jgi:hypothetical protein
MSRCPRRFDGANAIPARVMHETVNAREPQKRPFGTMEVLTAARPP